MLEKLHERLEAAKAELTEKWALQDQERKYKEINGHTPISNSTTVYL